MFANNFGKQKNICCGLVFDARKRPIPLISVDVCATVIHAVAQVEITQYYVNKEKQPIEAIYYFPVDPDGAVTNFQAELDGRVIKGTVKPRDEAQKVYAEAIADKTTSFLGEETTIDIFKLRVGFLKPGAHVKIVLEYMTEVKNEPGTNNIRFYIPTTIAPRYVSSTETDSQAIDIENMQFSSSSPAPLSIKVEVSIQGGIKAIESPTHDVTVQTVEPISENDNYHKAIVELSGQTTDMDRDFVLTIQPEEKHKPRMYSETNSNDNSTAVMIHLLPSFKLCELKSELIFVLDRSGSMMGRSIALAKEALLLILHSLPADCYFNIVGFGSTHTSVFPTSVKYDEENLKRAKAHAWTLDADMGGTEILEPLKEIFGQPEIDGYLRQIFVLTDGEVYNTNAVFGIVYANAHKARVFALGIGDATSHGLVGGIAKAGGGTAAYVTYNESVDKKVLDQLKNALQPSLTEIHLEWDGLSPTQEQQPPMLNKTKTLIGYNKPIESDVLTSDSSPRIKQSPERIPPVFDGSQLLVFGVFKKDCPKSVLITAQSPDGPLTVRVEHSPSNDHGEDMRLLFHRLAAIRLIRELEAKEDSEPRKSLKKEITDIACQNGITSRYTSFVAIDVTNEKQMIENWVMETRYVPNQLAHGWHGRYDLLALDDRADFVPAHINLKSAPTNSWFSSTSVIKSKIQSIAKNFFERSDPNDGLIEQQRRLQATKAQCDEIVGIMQPNAVDGLTEPQRRLKAMIAQCDEYVDTNVERAQDRDAKLSPSDDQCDCLSPNDAVNACSSSLLMRLINLQSYDGSFILNEELVPILGKSLIEMVEASNKHNLTNKVFATALAISFFVHNLADEREKWDLIVAKARKWLNAAVQLENVDRIIELTSEFLKSQ